jgi:dolichol kinase
VQVQVFQLALTVALVVAFQFAAARLRIGREAKRRWQHAITGHAFVVASYFLPIQACVPCLAVGAAGIWYLRFYRTDLFQKSFGPLLRPHETSGNRLPGAFYFLLGTALAAALFPIRTARYAVECLSICDPIAAYVGRSATARGRPWNAKVHESASLAGSAACFLSAWAIGHLYLAGNGGDGDGSEDPFSVRRAIFAGAAACCVSEAVPFGNDNLLIPLATGAAVHFASTSSR